MVVAFVNNQPIYSDKEVDYFGEVTWFDLPDSFNENESSVRIVNGSIDIVPKEDVKCIYNGMFSVNKMDDFSNWPIFKLQSTAEFNEMGDKTKVKWFKGGDLAIEEFPVYNRSKIGSGLTAQLVLKRQLTIRYYFTNGTFFDYEAPEKVYNEKQRREADSKSRYNIIENTKIGIGKMIVGRNIAENTPQYIEEELAAANDLINSLQTHINIYRNDREIDSLVNALKAIEPTERVRKIYLDEVIRMVNIPYYE